MSFRQVAKCLITNKDDSAFHLVISNGSLLDFHHENGAIVNAANEGCLGGGGVDGAISAAGGNQLRSDRSALPVLKNYQGDKVRCPTGDAKITGGPINQYGSIGTSYVIHAVGPAYFCYDDIQEPDELLRSAYQQSMERAREAKLEAVAFSLLSAGVYRGSRSRKDVLKIGVESLCEFEGYPELSEVHLFAFSEVELNSLLQIIKELGLMMMPRLEGMESK